MISLIVIFLRETNYAFQNAHLEKKIDKELYQESHFGHDKTLDLINSTLLVAKVRVSINLTLNYKGYK